MDWLDEICERLLKERLENEKDYHFLKSNT
jgi:hypothetical protein